MKGIQKVLCLLAVALLVGMYVATLVFAVSDQPAADGLFKASLACTILVPVFLYANILIYRYLKDRSDFQKKMQQDEEKEKQS